MDPVVESCCGLDVHQDSVVACVLKSKPGRKVVREMRTFGTFTEDLHRLRAWLVEHKCQQVGMESTGVYWMPVYECLEDESSFELFVGNATHLKAVPGRKTDAQDAEWIASLLRMGLIRKSYVPTRKIRDLRKLVRYRRGLVRERSTLRNRLLKQLELCNIKLASVAADVFGVSGWLMLKALAAGGQSPVDMAELARGKLRRKTNELARALAGTLDEEGRWILGQQIQRLESLDQDIVAVEARIDAKLAPHADLRARLITMPGVSAVVAAVLIAEIGTNVDAFQSDRALAKWAGLCPGNNESAGRRLGGRPSKGNEYLRSILVEAAQSAVRKKGSYFKAKFHKLKARRGYKRAIFAIAHKMLCAVFHMIQRKQVHRDLGDTYLDQLNEHAVVRSCTARLQAIGFEVTLQRRQIPDVPEVSLS